MNWLTRWAKFNVVGMMGMAVQLGTLAGLNRWAPGAYLWTSAAALEVTLLHNFAWHLNYTWRDRRERSSVAEKLIRFHLSNGLVSMAGNLGLMRVLMAEARMPLLAANGAAIAICSVVNFWLGNGWAFAASNPGSRAGSGRKRSRRVSPCRFPFSSGSKTTPHQ